MLVLGQLEMRDGSLVSTSPFGPDRAGNIVVNAERIELRDSSVIAAVALGEGAAGDVTVTATESLAVGFVFTLRSCVGSKRYLRHHLRRRRGQRARACEIGWSCARAAQIAAGAYGPGNSGDLTVNAREIVIRRDGRLQNGGQAGQTFNSGIVATTESEGDARDNRASPRDPHRGRNDRTHRSSSLSAGGDAGNVTRLR